MKTAISILSFCLFSTLSYSQAGFGFFDLYYATVSEDFIDNTSEAFDNAEDIKLAESGVGFGASGLFLFRKFAAGGGGGIAFIGNNDGSETKINIGHGYGFFGYNFSTRDDLLVIPSVRIGGFGNTLSFASTDTDIYTFGDMIYAAGEHELTSGSISFGVQVDVIKFFEIVPGLALGLQGYYNAPFAKLDWKLEGNNVTGFEKANYSHAGVVLKIGFGGGVIE